MFIIHLPTRKRNRQERSLTILRYGNVENSRSADGKQTFTARWKSRRLSHSSASMTVYAHSHSACCGEYLSCPILIEREKENKKRMGAPTSDNCIRC